MNIGKIDSKGQTLIIVMLIAIVLLIMMLSLTSKVILNTSQNSLTYSGQIAFSAAQSGIQNGLSYIGKNEFSSTTIPQQLPLLTAPTICNPGSVKPTLKCTYNITPQTQNTFTVNQGQSMSVNLQGSITSTPSTTTGYSGILNNWTTQGAQSLPQNISKAGNTSYGANEYIIGGLNGGTALNSVYETTMSQTGTSNWSNVSNLPNAVYNNSTVTNGSYIYSIGGINNIAYTYYTYALVPYQYPIYTWVYSCQYTPFSYYVWWSPYLQHGYYNNCSWHQQLTWITSYRYQYTPHTYYYTSPTNSVYVASLSNLGSWNQTSSLPQSIYHASSVEYNNNIFVFGGRNYYGATMNTIYEATIGSGGGLSSWTQVGTMSPLYGAGITVSNGNAYIVGGNNGGGGTNSIYVYNLANISLPPQQGSFSGSIYDEGLGILQDPGNTTVNYLYAFGGILNGGTSQSTYYTTLTNLSSWQSAQSTMEYPTSAMGYSTYTGAGANDLFSFGGYQNVVEYTSIGSQVVHTVNTVSPYPNLVIQINSITNSSTANYELQILSGSSTSQTMEICLITGQKTGATNSEYIKIPANSTIAYITPLNSKMLIDALPSLSYGSIQILSSNCSNTN